MFYFFLFAPRILHDFRTFPTLLSFYPPFVSQAFKKDVPSLSCCLECSSAPAARRVALRYFGSFWALRFSAAASAASVGSIALAPEMRLLRPLASSDKTDWWSGKGSFSIQAMYKYGCGAIQTPQKNLTDILYLYIYISILTCWNAILSGWFQE